MIRNTKRSSPVGPPFVSLVVLVTAALLALIQSLQVQCTDVILCDFIKNYDPSKLDHLNRNEKEDRLEDIKRTLEKMIPNMCAELGSYTNKDGRSCFDFKGIPTSTCNADNEKGKDKSKVVGLCKNTVKCKANETINLDNIILAFHRTIVQEYRTIAIETSSEVIKTLNPPLKYALGYHCEGIKGLYELKEKLNATDIGTLKKKLKKKDLQSQYFKTLKSLKNFTRYFKYYFWGSGANLQCDKTEDKDERYSKAYISGFAAKQSYFRLDTKKQGTIVQESSTHYFSCFLGIPFGIFLDAALRNIFISLDFSFIPLSSSVFPFVLLVGLLIVLFICVRYLETTEGGFAQGSSSVRGSTSSVGGELNGQCGYSTSFMGVGIGAYLYLSLAFLHHLALMYSLGNLSPDVGVSLIFLSDIIGFALLMFIRISPLRCIAIVGCGVALIIFSVFFRTFWWANMFGIITSLPLVASLCVGAYNRSDIKEQFSRGAYTSFYAVFDLMGTEIFACVFTLNVLITLHILPLHFSTFFTETSVGILASVVLIAVSISVHFQKRVTLDPKAIASKLVVPFCILLIFTMLGLSLGTDFAVSSSTIATAEDATRDEGVRTLRIGSYNVHMGYNANFIQDLNALAKTIDDANVSVVGMQEVSRGLVLTGGADMARVLSRLLGMKTIVFNPTYNPIGGDVILTREKVEEHGVSFMTNGNINQHTNRGYSYVIFTRSEALGKVMYINTHLEHREKEIQLRQSQIESICSIAEKKNMATRTVISGDMNSTPYGKEWNTFIKSGYKDAWDTISKRKDLPQAKGLTYPSDPSSNFKEKDRLDWIMYGKDLNTVDFKVVHSFDSDHMLVLWWGLREYLNVQAYNEVFILIIVCVYAFAPSILTWHLCKGLNRRISGENSQIVCLKLCLVWLTILRLLEQVSWSFIVDLHFSLLACACGFGAFAVLLSCAIQESSTHYFSCFLGIPFGIFLDAALRNIFISLDFSFIPLSSSVFPFVLLVGLLIVLFICVRYLETTEGGFAQGSSSVRGSTSSVGGELNGQCGYSTSFMGVGIGAYLYLSLAFLHHLALMYSLGNLSPDVGVSLIFLSDIIGFALLMFIRISPLRCIAIVGCGVALIIFSVFFRTFWWANMFGIITSLPLVASLCVGAYNRSDIKEQFSRGAYTSFYAVFDLMGTEIFACVFTLNVLITLHILPLHFSTFFTETSVGILASVVLIAVSISVHFQKRVTLDPKAIASKLVVPFCILLIFTMLGLSLGTDFAVSSSTIATAEDATRDEGVRTLRIGSYNVHMGYNANFIQDLNALAKTIDDANVSVVGMQEVSRGLVLTGGADMARVLSRLLGMKTIVFNPTYNPIGGDVILTREKVEEHGVSFMTNGNINQHTNRGYSYVIFTRSEALGKVMYINTHLEHREKEIQLRQSQIESICSIAEKKNMATRTVISGDMNSTPYGKEWNTFIKSGYKDAWDTISKRKDLPQAKGLTYPSDPSSNFKEKDRLDWIMYGKDLNTVDFKVVHSFDSDHMLVVASLEASK
eukprot:Nk52_evm20s240 gene=Nk52_evmTU20s240